MTTDSCHSAAPGAGPPAWPPQGMHSQQADFMFLFSFSWVKHKPIVNDVIGVFDWFSYYLVHLVFYLVNSL